MALLVRPETSSREMTCQVSDVATTLTTVPLSVSPLTCDAEAARVSPDVSVG